MLKPFVHWTISPSLMLVWCIGNENVKPMSRCWLRAKHLKPFPSCDTKSVIAAAMKSKRSCNFLTDASPTLVMESIKSSPWKAQTRNCTSLRHVSNTIVLALFLHYIFDTQDGVITSTRFVSGISTSPWPIGGHYLLHLWTLWHKGNFQTGYEVICIIIGKSTYSKNIF